MIQILIGIGSILGVLVLLYTLGIITNLWSNEIINPSSIWDVVDRGGKIVVILFVTMLVLFVLYGLGIIITNFPKFIN